MASTAVVVNGLKQTVKDLEKLNVDLADLKAAFQRIGDIVAQEARALVPRQSGALAATIKPSKTKNKAVVRAGSAKVPYAGVQNYGWPAHNIVKKNFLDNAMDAKKEAVLKALEDELDKLIRSLDLN